MTSGCSLICSPCRSAPTNTREREALLYAMQQLSGGSTEAFDLSGILPLPRRRVAVRCADSGVSRRIEHLANSHPRRLLLVLAGLVLAVGIAAGIVLGTAWLAMVGPR